VIETIVPTDEEHWLALRTRDLTSTEAAALFGCSPYTTLFELYHRKREGVIVRIESNERMTWGNRLQDAIAKGIAQDEGWEIRPMKEYMRDPQHQLGASFDYAIGDEGLLEIKNVDSLAFKEGWLVTDEGLEAPPHIEVQVQQQLAISQRKYAYIGALVGGNRIELIKREPDQKIIDSIKSKAGLFWSMVMAGKEPTPDFEKDAAFISQLYSYAQPGKVVDGSANQRLNELALEYKYWSEQEKRAKDKRDAAKAEMLMMIGDAERVNGGPFTISAGVVGPSEVAYTREGYRNFRISWKKVK
jgi:putative phage-type endonuclease